jgi:hypothetical protein
MVAEPDFETATIDAGTQLLLDNHQYQLGDALAAISKRAASAAGAGSGEAAGTPGGKRRRGGAGEGGEAAGGDPMAVDGQPAVAGAPAAVAGGDLYAAAAAAVANGGGGSAAAVAAIDRLVESWKLPGPGSYEEAEKDYTAALVEESVGVFDSGAPGAYNSHFTAIGSQVEGAGSEVGS